MRKTGRRVVRPLLGCGAPVWAEDEEPAVPLEGDRARDADLEPAFIANCGAAQNPHLQYAKANFVVQR